MSEQPPYAAPPGFKWVKSWFGLGPLVLVEDEQFPLPPPGYRYRPHFLTGKPELVALYGKGVDFFADGNEKKVPRGVNMAAINNYGTPGSPIYYQGPVQESGQGIDFLKGDTSAPRPGSDKNKRDEAMFG